MAESTPRRNSCVCDRVDVEKTRMSVPCLLAVASTWPSLLRSICLSSDEWARISFLVLSFSHTICTWPGVMPGSAIMSARMQQRACRFAAVSYNPRTFAGACVSPPANAAYRKQIVRSRKTTANIRHVMRMLKICSAKSSSVTFFARRLSQNSSLFGEPFGDLPPPTMAKWRSSSKDATAMPLPGSGASFNVLIQSLDRNARTPLSRPHMKRVDSSLKDIDNTAGSRLNCRGCRVSMVNQVYRYAATEQLCLLSQS